MKGDIRITTGYIIGPSNGRGIHAGHVLLIVYEDNWQNAISFNDMKFHKLSEFEAKDRTQKITEI